MPRHLITMLFLLILLMSGCENVSTPQEPGKKAPAKIHLVETQTATPAPITHSAIHIGTLEIQRQVKVFNQEEGRILEISALEGDRVDKGALLVRLDTTLLTAQFDKAQAVREQAQQDLDRINKLVKQRLAADDELARTATELRVAEAEESLLRIRLGFSEIRAPFNGIVSNTYVEAGDIAPRHTHLLTLIDPSSLVTRVEISELLLPFLHKGMNVKVAIDALKNSQITGIIHRIYPLINEHSHQGTIEVKLSSLPRGIRAGQLCRVSITTPKKSGISIPLSILQRDSRGEYIYIVDQDDIVRSRYIRSGLHQDNHIEIVEGIETGARIVSKGFLGLKEGTKVRVVEPHSS